MLISFDEEDMEGTIQPHDDALVVTAWISGFLVKRVIIESRLGKRSRHNVLEPI